MATRFDFNWPVSKSGYEVIEAYYDGGINEVCIVQRPSTKASEEFIKTKPMEIAGLFLKFAELDFTDEAISTFVNEYGLLHEPERINLETNKHGNFENAVRVRKARVTNQARAAKGKYYFEESTDPGTVDRYSGPRKKIELKGNFLGLYDDTLLDMKTCVNFWKASENNNLAILNKSIKVQRHRTLGIKIVNCRFTMKDSWKDFNEQFPLPEFIQEEDLAELAVYAILGTINRNLEGKCLPRLTYLKRSKATLQLFPCDLASALWLQFAEVLDGGTLFRPCLNNCGEYICVSGNSNKRDISRIDKKYCSDTCRTKHNRKLQYRARKRYEEGESIQDISKGLSVDVDRVKKYVSGKKKLRKEVKRNV